MYDPITDFTQLPVTMTVAHVQKVLGISRQGAYELVHRADFPALRIGNRILILKAPFVAWLQAQVPPVA